jgi:hypothetical protein
MSGIQFIVGRILVDEKGEGIPKRCRQFIAHLLETGMLVEVSKEQRQVRQSLLSAKEIAETHSATLGRLGASGEEDVIQQTRKILTGGFPAEEGV